MRILHAYNQHRSGGGATAVTEDSIRALRKHGEEVEVFTRRSIDLPKTRLGHIQAAASAFTGGQGLRDFIALLERFRPDVVHAHELFPLITPWILPECTRRGVPVVMSWNDYHATCPARNHFRNGQVCTECLGGHEFRSILHNCRDNYAESVVMAFYCRMVRRKGLYSNHACHYTVLSEFTRDWLIRHADVPAGIVTVNPPIVTVPERPANPGEGRYAAFGGRFVPEKGIDTLMEASRLSGVPVKLTRNAEHFVTVDIPPGTDVLVTRNRGELDAFYRAARFVVMPSRWFETFGVVAAECMALGIPAIVPNLGATGCLLDNGVEGLHFEPGNAADLAQAMRRLWDSPVDCERMGSAARDRALRLWNEERHYQTLISVYEKLIEANHRHRRSPEAAPAVAKASPNRV